MRRIEAVAGPGVYDLLSEREKIVKSLAASLKVQPDKLESRIAVMSEEQRKLAAEVDSLKVRPAHAPKCALADTVAHTVRRGHRQG